MPKLSTLFNDYLVYMYDEQNSSHNLPHIHIIKGDINVPVDFNGNLLIDGENPIPTKDFKKIRRWISAHIAELNDAWNKISNGEHPGTISNVIPPEHPIAIINESASAPITEYKNELDVKVAEVYPLPNHTLLCRFSNDQWVLYNASDWLKYPAFSDLANNRLFNSVQIDYGNPTWRSINEEITAYDIYVDGIAIELDATVQYLKALSELWKPGEHPELITALYEGYMAAYGLPA